MWNRFQTFLQTIPALLTPQPVRMEPALDNLLSDAISKAVHDPAFRTQLLAHPQQTLASEKIDIPPQQQVIVVESTAEQIFLVLPIQIDREREILQTGLNSQDSLRAIRSKIILHAWQDPDYKAKLLSDPKAVLIAEGFQIPIAATVKVLENDLEHLHLVIPCLH
jgi:Nitrile hydratase, alpha chain